jgi:hypothetical protein
MGTRGEFKTGGNNRRLQFPGVIHAMSAIRFLDRASICRNLMTVIAMMLQYTMQEHADLGELLPAQTTGAQAIQ